MAREHRSENRRRTGKNGDGPIVIKKYANRRLYNTATSSYVTLDHLCQMVKDDVDFVVYDAKTGEDITRSVLTQIIVEEESKGTNLLPITFLRQLIGFYGDNMQAVVPRYLEQMMTAFAENQDRLRQQMQETMTGMFPFSGNLEEVRRQNAALMESAMKVFNPFAAGQHPDDGSGTDTGEERSAASEAESLAQLKQQVDMLQQQLEALGRQQEARNAASGQGAQADDAGGTAETPEPDNDKKDESPVRRSSKTSS